LLLSQLKTPHAWCGVGVIIGCVALGLAGGIFLHPDFGVDKTNQLIRKIHKTASRTVILFAWITALGGLLQLTSDVTTLAMYSLPLLALVPFTLM
jgi:Eukaryotic cytochrome b561